MQRILTGAVMSLAVATWLVGLLEISDCAAETEVPERVVAVGVAGVFSFGKTLAGLLVRLAVASSGTVNEATESVDCEMLAL